MVEFGKPFGLDRDLLRTLDWEIAIARILTDVKSDFIYAPHLNFVYQHNATGLIDSVKGELSKGNFLPGQPITLEIPKSSRMKLATHPPRNGPNYTRPGSILFPKDRLFYQVLGDAAVDSISNRTDTERSFSHRIDLENPEKMFVPTRVCWANFQQALQNGVLADQVNYVIKLDIANFFSSINQHTLVNMLSDAGYTRTFVDRLENVLVTYTTNRSSRGIIQGLFTSDMLGNYYLSPFDRFLQDEGVQSARYVDDIYIFVNNAAAGESIIRDIAPELRSYDLALNEAKCVIFPKTQLVVEEPDLELLFQAAIDEVRAQLNDEHFETEYGFQSAWIERDGGVEHEDENEDDGAEGQNIIELEATKRLFDSIGEFVGHEESIERFCLPLFARVESDYAIDHVVDNFDERPSMAQIYCAYLSKFPDLDPVKNALAEKLGDERLHDWQRMWILAALLQAAEKSDMAEQAAYQIFRDRSLHDSVRAAAAIYLGRFGDAGRRRNLLHEYNSASEYLQGAIFFISQLSWPGVEKATASASWSQRGELNRLISGAFVEQRKNRTGGVA